MPKILLVDDSGADRQYIGGLLSRVSDIQVDYASNGAEALEKLAQATPDLVITDLVMPVLDGLQLVEEIHQRYPLVPVILLTSQGSEHAAVEALRRGAASYISKHRLPNGLLQTVSKVLIAASRQRAHAQLFGCITETSCVFVLENDLSLIGPLIGYLQESLAQLGVLDPTERTRIGVALEEALSNAIIHGNLELSSELKDADEKVFQALLDQRRNQPPYCLRKVSLEISLTPKEARFVIADEGPGFHPDCLPDPTHPANLEKCSGRGVLLMRTFMDEVQYNEKGNQVTLIKRLGKQSAPPSDERSAP